MLSINTNLSSLIAQNSMRTSTNKLNQAIERMTTGAKINHAKDNAANYSINTNMTTKISAYDVAADNVAMGLDMVTTASDTLTEMQSHAERLRALATQARNGTYGAQSLNAIQAEANAITKEIERLYNTSKYNGISLFNRQKYTIAQHLPQAGESGFIDETALSGTDPPTAKYNGFIENPVTYTEARLAEMLASGDLVVLETDLESFDSTKSYLIKDKAQLEHLAELVNNGKDSSGVTFILGADIDLKNEEWTPIGNATYAFKGIFDGNGHKISNLKIDKSTVDYQGLFGYAYSAEIKNVSLDGGHVKCNSRVGFLVGCNNNSSITNCYATGSVSGEGDYVGGLVGANTLNSTITNCYATGNVTGASKYTGGLVGLNYTNSAIENCYATGNVTGQETRVGGLVGENQSSSTITNSYATGDIIGKGENVGGLVGLNYTNSAIENCYATGNVIGKGYYTGGLVGINNSNSTVTNSYATGDVIGQGNCTGGFVGENQNNSTITNSFATGNVIGQGYSTGGLVGNNYVNSTITNSYATGDVTGVANTGGLIGLVSASDSTAQVRDCAAYGNVYSTSDHSGSLIGRITISTDGVNFTDVTITNCEVMPSEKNPIGRVVRSDTWAVVPDYDISEWLNEIEVLEPIDISTNLQVGIHGNDASLINFNTNFKLDLSVFEEGVSSDGAFRAIDDFVNLLSEKQTKLGSVSNRLESVLDEILIQHDNLVASRSTIRDADIAKVSSKYIQQQILQQASATLLSSAQNVQAQNVLGLLQSLR